MQQEEMRAYFRWVGTTPTNSSEPESSLGDDSHEGYLVSLPISEYVY
jgi:hypothetical protein